MVNQMTSFVLSADGGQVCKTPNLDRLAAKGCGVREGLLRLPALRAFPRGDDDGLGTVKIGAYGNGAEFRASIPTFAHYLCDGQRVLLLSVTSRGHVPCQCR